MELTIDHVETEKKFDQPVGYIKPCFDLFAEDSSHELIRSIAYKLPDIENKRG